MTKHLEREIARLKTRMLNLCVFAQDNVQKAITAFLKNKKELAKEVILLDKDIDQEEVEIEEECLKILVLHQPVAIDLRFIIAVLKINNDLERIGDLAANIAENTLSMNLEHEINSPIDLDQMANDVKKMLQMSMDALMERDSAQAYEVLKLDDKIDLAYGEMNRSLVTRIQNNPDETQNNINLFLIARQLERIGDHATNIAEDIIYMVEGEIIRHQSGYTEE